MAYGETGKRRSTAKSDRGRGQPANAGASGRGKGCDANDTGHIQDWHELVARAAYYRAVARRFSDGSPEDDWFAAEAELHGRLRGNEEK